MDILLFGRDNSITHTICDMLNSAAGWMATLVYGSEEGSGIEIKDHMPDYDILVANLTGFSQSPQPIVKKISAFVPTVPLLVLYSYSREILATPLISAGATGYLQVGSSETELLRTVKKVADGEEVILTENTY